MPKLTKVLVANRGAIARRVIRACDAMGLASVAVYSDADQGAPYLAEASESYALAGVSATDTYLDVNALLDIARRSGADAVHPGYGFLSESADFAAAVIDAGMVFIGPSPNLLRQMGDKVAARAIMQQAGFPVFPGSDLISDAAVAERVAAEIGYPVLIKPTGGGGGMGMLRVDDVSALQGAVRQASAVAASAFGDGGVFLEKFIDQPRHIEFQVIGSAQHGAVHAFERECTIQRRNQKLIEESPAPNIDAAILLALAEQAARVSADLGYDNVGTMETLMDASGSFGFLEMNTRIQVEHGVTEAVTGLDLVQLQFALAQGAPPPSTVSCNGHAIEARIYAEDAQTLLPSTGRLAVFELPQMHGVRIETGYAAGQTITPYYDAMLAKVIATGHTRELAIGRLAVALRAIEIQGVQTNQALLGRVLGHDDFLAGQVDTGFVARLLGTG